MRVGTVPEKYEGGAFGIINGLKVHLCKGGPFRCGADLLHRDTFHHWELSS